MGNADGLGAAARFGRPADVAVDTQGSLFVADRSNQAIRRISPAGSVSTYASSATGAPFEEPQGLVFDANGNLYVSDRAGAIDKVSPQGAVSLFAGNLMDGGSTDGAGANAGFFYPQDMAVDMAGNLYVIDGNGALIRKITPTGAVSTLAGTPFVYESKDGTGAAAHFTSASGITIDGDGNLYVGDITSIRKISPEGVVTTVAGAGASGAGATSRFYRPASLVMTGPKSLFFTACDGVFQLQLP